MFGSAIAQIKSFNLILSAFTVAGIFLLGKKLSSSMKIAVFAALVYAFWPADIMYKNLPTGEHVFAMLFPYACLFFLSGIDLINSDLTKGGAYILLAGLVLGLLDLYKPVGIVLLIAFLIAIFLLRYSANDNLQKTPGIRGSLLRMALIIGLVIPYWAVKEIGYLLIQHEALARTNKYGFASTLRVGLDPNLQGRYSREIQAHIEDLMIEHHEDYPLVNKLLFQETVEIIRQHAASEYLKLLSTKFCWAWCSDRVFYSWATRKQIDSSSTSFIPSRFRVFANTWIDAYYMFLLIFSVAGALYCAIWRRNDLALPIGLFIFGYSVLLLLSEVQPRYRSLLFSSLPMFAAYGIYAASQLVSRPQPTTPNAGQKTP
jgi:hypothetical protein